MHLKHVLNGICLSSGWSAHGQREQGSGQGKRSHTAHLGYTLVPGGAQVWQLFRANPTSLCANAREEQLCWKQQGVWLYKVNNEDQDSGFL